LESTGDRDQVLHREVACVLLPEQRILKVLLEGYSIRRFRILAMFVPVVDARLEVLNYLAPKVTVFGELGLLILLGPAYFFSD
jgi:hypothetical protein